MIVLLVFCVSSVSSFILQNTAACSTEINITVTDTWIQPSTPVSVGEKCKLNFFISDGYFMVLDLILNNLKTGETVEIWDNYFPNDDLTVIRGPHKQLELHQAWSANQLTIWFLTDPFTSVLFSLNITVFEATPNVNVAGRFTTDLNKPTKYIYLSDWIEGSSYIFTSKTGNLTIDYPFIGDNFDRSQWNNIFIYEGDRLIGGVNHVNGLGNYVSQSPTVTFYMAKKVNISSGALMVTDYKNVNQLSSYYVSYVPICSMYMNGTYYFSNGSATTIVGDKDGSTPISIFDVFVPDSSSFFSVMLGGPLADHHLATNLTSNLPPYLAGNSWTFYYSGSGTGHFSFMEVPRIEDGKGQKMLKEIAKCVLEVIN